MSCISERLQSEPLAQSALFWFDHYLMQNGIVRFLARLNWVLSSEAAVDIFPVL
jgi:hypothetical protein